jgi:hypothetical protein
LAARSASLSVLTTRPHRYYALVQKVFPPRHLVDPECQNGAPSTASPPPIIQHPHKIGGDLKVPTKDAHAKDDPTKYYYAVQILELEREKSHEKNKSAKVAGKESNQTGSTMEVQCSVMRYALLDICSSFHLVYTSPSL